MGSARPCPPLKKSLHSTAWFMARWATLPTASNASDALKASHWLKEYLTSRALCREGTHSKRMC
ncbi:hypothetical protein E2C01_043285 [Portunus trituberculatus]|uniref:Uncharacterized protein n=1 Tax=Portunus trituberculatus TaxID=210409 RepID=A0A5B7FZ51_PORTR|nr:hypothetical protein [Portunus trituberculatus]